MITNLKMTNAKGDEFNFSRSFRLTKGLDLSSLAAQVNYSTSNKAGSSYQSTRLENRDFDLEFKMLRGYKDEATMDELRSRLYRVFNPNFNPIRIDLTMTNGKSYFLEAHLTSAPIMPPDRDNNNASGQRVLLQFTSTDPYIYETVEKRVDIALWVPNLEFDFEIPEDGIEFEYRAQSLFKNVFNEGQEYAGLKVEFKALLDVINPSIVNVNTYETLKLETTMLAGDIIELINTHEKIKLTLIRNNVRTDAFNTLTLDSALLLLAPGDNIFRYDADEGVDYLEVAIMYHTQWIGV